MSTKCICDITYSSRTNGTIISTATSSPYHNTWPLCLKRLMSWSYRVLKMNRMTRREGGRLPLLEPPGKLVQWPGSNFFPRSLAKNAGGLDEQHHKHHDVSGYILE